MGDNNEITLSGNHEYHDIYGNKYTSVTTVIKKYFEPFNADNVISKMMASNNWPKSIYYGLTAEQIKNQWRSKAELGTKLHSDIELYLKRKILPKNDIEFLYFLEYYRDKLCKYSLVASELIVHDSKRLIAGTLDALFVDNEGNYHLYDWKRVANLKYTNPLGIRGTGPFTNLYDCDYIHYSLQLNLYSELLYNCKNIKISTMTLVLLHPDNNSYVEIKVNNMKPYIDELLK